MNKIEIRKMMELAASNTHERYNNFQGVIPFGSFVKAEIKNPVDIDLIPVLETYRGCWRFSTDDEGYHDIYYSEYKRMEEFFGAHFTEFAQGYGGLFKTCRNKNGLFHVESLVALDNLPLLKDHLGYYGAKPENFIGTEEAARIIKGFYKKPYSK